VNKSFPVTGFAFGLAAGTGTNFSQCLIEDNFVYGSTTGIAAGGYLCDCTLYRNNVVYGGTTGIADTNTNGGIGASAFYANNFVSGGTTAMTFTALETTRSLGNFTASAGTHIGWHATT
jgi:hypothetical protein